MQVPMLTVVTQLTANTAAAVGEVPAEFGPGASLRADNLQAGPGFGPLHCGCLLILI